MTLLLLACATPAVRYTDDAITAGLRARLDRDADGTIVAAEYEAARWNGPPFASADADADGRLSTPELVTLLAVSSATAFDGAPPPAGRQAVRQPGLSEPQRQVWEVLLWLADTLREAGRPTPDPEAVDRAVQTGSFRSPETLAVLAALRDEWALAGWTWPLAPLPAELSPAALAPVPRGDADPNAAVARRFAASFDWGPGGPPVARPPDAPTAPSLPGAPTVPDAPPGSE